MSFLDQPFNVGGRMPPSYSQFLDEQLEDEEKHKKWLLERLGKLTASCFSDLMTSPTSKRDKAIGLSPGAQSYILKRVWERITDQFHDKQFSSSATEHGNENETEAIQLYKKRFGIEVQFYGVNQKLFKYGKEDNIGGTPDGVTLDIFDNPEGGQEVKCPESGYNVLKLAGCKKPEDLKVVEKKYYWQVIGQMLITGAVWWDFIVFDPRVKGGFLHVLRFERSEVAEDIKLLKEKLKISEQFLIEKTDEFKNRRYVS